MMAGLIGYASLGFSAEQPTMPKTKNVPVSSDQAKSLWAAQVKVMDAQARAQAASQKLNELAKSICAGTIQPTDGDNFVCVVPESELAKPAQK